MKLSEFDFKLPKKLIAQQPNKKRDQCKLLVLNKKTGAITHSTFADISNFLTPGDLLVLNNTKVFPARLLGKRISDNRKFECLLINKIQKPKDWIPRLRQGYDGQADHKTRSIFGDDNNVWSGLINPGAKININDKIIFTKGSHKVTGKILEKTENFKVKIKISGNIDKVGHIPLPPYIKRPDTKNDKLFYQTVYAKEQGSIAAPTAGLHFTPKLLKKLQQKGVQIAEITLHVGYGTFKPVRSENIQNHVVDPENYHIDGKALKTINKAIFEHRRVIAVGTTTVRCLESAGTTGKLSSNSKIAKIYIHPGHKFKITNGLITNFHLPKSSLLILVSAFAGKNKILNAYKKAVKKNYQFYSYGDAMLIV